MKTETTLINESLLVFIILIGLFLFNHRYQPRVISQSPITDPDLPKATLRDHSTLVGNGPLFLHLSVLQLYSQSIPYGKFDHTMGHFKIVT